MITSITGALTRVLDEEVRLQAGAFEYAVLVPEVVRLVREAGVNAPIIVGGIIPEEDRPRLAAAGVARVYTPKDFQLSRIMADIAELAGAGRRE